MKKDIIIVTIALGNDGAERVLTELSNEWIKQGHKITIIQTGADNYGCSYNISNDVEIINIHVNKKNKISRYISEIKELRKILKERKNSVAISFIVSSIFILCLSSLFLKNKVIVSERNNPRMCPSGKLQQKLRNLSFCLADVCVFQTDEAKQYFSKKVQKKGVIIPNPINSNLLPIHEGKRRKVIITACRLHPQKNLPMLFNAFAKLSEEYPEYVLEVYGQGDEEQKLREYIHELGMNEKIKIFGFTSDIHSKMVDCAMYVSSSDYEGISNSMLEALGMGVPTVVTDCPVGGARMMINSNENGILVPVGDEVAMYKAMKKIVSDENFANQISLKAYEIREKLPIEKISKRWIELM